MHADKMNTVMLLNIAGPQVHPTNLYASQLDITFQQQLARSRVNASLCWRGY